MPAGRVMAEAPQAQDAETAGATAEAPAHAGPGMQDKVVRADAARPPMDAGQLPDRDRAHGRTGRLGTRQSAREQVPTEGVATRAPLRRPGRTDHGPRMIGPARAVRPGETRASAATGRTATHLALARTDPPEARVLSVETAVRLGARQRPTGTGAQAHRRRDRRVRVTATGRRGRIVGRARLIPGRPVRATAIVRGARIVGRVQLIPARRVRATAIGREARIEGRARLILARPVRATASDPRAWFVGRVRPILGRRVRGIEVGPTGRIVDPVRLTPDRRVRAIAIGRRAQIVGLVRQRPALRARGTAIGTRVQIVGQEAVPVGRCGATRGRLARRGSYVPPSSRDRRSLARTAASASRCHLAWARVTTSRRLQRSIRRTYLEACALS